MNKLLTNFTGGQPFFISDLEFMDDAYRNSIYAFYRAISEAYTPNFIVCGCSYTQNGDSVTLEEGYIWLNGELLHVEQQTFYRLAVYGFGKIVEYDEDINSYTTTFKDSSTNKVHQINKAVINNTLNDLRYDGPSLSSILSNKSFHENGALNSYYYATSGGTVDLLNDNAEHTLNLSDLDSNRGLNKFAYVKVMISSDAARTIIRFSKGSNSITRSSVEVDGLISIYTHSQVLIPLEGNSFTYKIYASGASNVYVGLEILGFL